MVAPLVAAAGIGAASSLIGGIFQKQSAKDAASTQMAFQERMYKNRYQYQMADMRKAGLNPILSYRQGPGGAPAGSSYTPQNIGEAAGRGAASAVALRRAAAEIRNIDADTALKDENRVVATTQHQLNDIMGRQNVLRNEVLGLDAYSARELMELLQSGGQVGEGAAALNRLRRLLGIGGGS